VVPLFFFISALRKTYASPFEIVSSFHSLRQRAFAIWLSLAEITLFVCCRFFFLDTLHQWRLVPPLRFFFDAAHFLLTLSWVPEKSLSEPGCLLGYVRSPIILKSPVTCFRSWLEQRTPFVVLPPPHLRLSCNRLMFSANFLTIRLRHHFK